MSKAEPLERYRSAYYKLRAALHDQRANLDSFAARTDGIRNLLDRRTSIGVIYLSIAELATIESIYGWRTHDEVLSAASAHARAAAATMLHPETIVALNRVAGEAIVCFVPCTQDGSEWSHHALSETAERVRQRVAAAFQTDEFIDLQPAIQVHAGYSFLGLNPFYRFERGIYRAIDVAAKQEQQRRARRDQDQMGHVHEMIRSGQVDVHFQPVMNLATGEPLGYEALARGPKNSGVEMPADLWRATRSAGVLSQLESMCKSCALAAAESLPGDGDLFLNGSLNSVRSGLFREASQTAAQGRYRVVVDLSERELNSGDEPQFQDAVTELKSEGYAVALDDLGAGASRMETIEKMRPDFVKLDPSITRDIDKHPIKQEVLEPLIIFAAATGAKLLAEGVETAEEADFLKQAGVPLAQGFYYSDPLPVASIPVNK